ncbi:hypothetical protein OU789_14020 [Halocynthiibacter sp. C4]|uniref:TlpA family protein disulfide reductase n=1 Tax=Halocynthiibacter sp. C4 TaxID=2992758 RepID=UPI00237ABCF2|nr:deiodinase-like protein [Halocynthiibacter sp. C4]MDE0591050.1 hypothetical protein [Halocynthiibacter sp. C4]
MSDAVQITAKPQSSRETYTYDTFTTGLILEDLHFRATDPAPGQKVPAFDMELIEGGRLRSSDLGQEPVLLVFGSRTCPVTVSSRAPLERLFEKFGDKIRFVLVNTREAHPGELISQPKSIEQKRDHARNLGTFMGAHFETAVDDIDGSFHRAMGPKPNSAYIIAPDGRIIFRAHWANDTASLEPALEAATTGTQPRQVKSRRLVRPLLKAIGYLPDVVRTAGRKVERDVWRAVPPFAVMGHLSRLFFFLPIDMRGPAVVLLLALGGGLLIWG